MEVEAQGPRLTVATHDALCTTRFSRNAGTSLLSDPKSEQRRHMQDFKTHSRHMQDFKTHSRHMQDFKTWGTWGR